MAAMKHRNSSFGRKGTFECGSCGRPTREVRGLGNETCCPDCYELAGIENALSDDGPTVADTYRAEAKRLWTLIAAKGNEITARRNFSAAVVALATGEE